MKQPEPSGAAASGAAFATIEARFEPFVQFAEVSVKTIHRILTVGRLFLDGHQACGHQPLNFRHCRKQATALGRAQGI